MEKLIFVSNMEFLSFNPYFSSKSHSQIEEINYFCKEFETKNISMFYFCKSDVKNLLYQAANQDSFNSQAFGFNGF